MGNFDTTSWLSAFQFSTGDTIYVSCSVFDSFDSKEKYRDSCPNYKSVIVIQKATMRHIIYY